MNVMMKIRMAIPSTNDRIRNMIWYRGMHLL